MHTLNWQAQGLEQTVFYAEQLARAVKPKLLTATGPFILFLEGDLGAGKTSFAQGFLAELGVSEAVTSPTFNLVLHYPASFGEIHHLDAYRLTDAADCWPLGLDEWLLPGHVIVVEWPTHIAGAMQPDVLLNLSDLEAGAARALTVSSQSQLGEQILSSLMSQATPKQKTQNN